MSLGLVVDSVTKAFASSRILDDVILRVPGGTICALLGPSGSGKTTLLRIIAGLDRPDSGAVQLDDTVLVSARDFVAPERRRLGMVFQDLAIFPHLSVGKNVAFGIDHHAPGGKHRVETVLEMVGLNGFASRSPATLSGGQLQRVALARALAPAPKALLLDEPFSNLDVALRARVRSELHRLLNDAGVTSVFVTHDQQEAFVLGHRVAVMKDGHIVQCAPPRDLYQSPVDAWTASFVGEVNLIEGTVTGTSAETSLGRLAVDATRDGRAQILLRPELLEIEPGDAATIQHIEFHGHDSMLELRHRTGAVIRVRTRTGTDSIGDNVNINYCGPPAKAYPVTEVALEAPQGSKVDQTTGTVLD